MTVIDTPSERVSFDAFDILAVGDTLGVATHPGLQFFDIQNPRHPVLFGTAACGQASGIVHDGRHWIVSQIHGGVAIVDSTRPASMNLVEQERRVFGYWGPLGAEGDLAAVPDDKGQLRMVRLEPSGGMRDLGILDPLFSVGSLLFHRGHMFHVRPGQVGALTVYETSGPGLPRLVNTTNVIAYLADLAVEGNQLYVLAAGIGTPGRTPDPDGLLVFDIADPAGPIRRGQFRMSGDPQALAVTHQLGYVAHGTNGITVLDLTNPDQIRVAGQVPGEGFTDRIVIAKGYAFGGDDPRRCPNLPPGKPNHATAGQCDPAGATSCRPRRLGRHRLRGFRIDTGFRHPGSSPPATSGRVHRSYAASIHAAVLYDQRRPLGGIAPEWTLPASTSTLLPVMDADRPSTEPRMVSNRGHPSSGFPGGKLRPMGRCPCGRRDRPDNRASRRSVPAVSAHPSVNGRKRSLRVRVMSTSPTRRGPTRRGIPDAAAKNGPEPRHTTASDFQTHRIGRKDWP